MERKAGQTTGPCRTLLQIQWDATERVLSWGVTWFCERFHGQFWLLEANLKRPECDEGYL